MDLTPAQRARMRELLALNKSHLISTVRRFDARSRSALAVYPEERLAEMVIAAEAARSKAAKK